jgi:hypothetical protein
MERSRDEFEYELIDTGIFNDNRYFDVFVEYAKESPEEIFIRLTICNRGPEPATLHLLPTLWFRNTWSWSKDAPKPSLKRLEVPGKICTVKAEHPSLGIRYFACEGNVSLLFTENETNKERIFCKLNRTPYVKDAIDNYLVHGRKKAVNPTGEGTKVAAHYLVEVGSGEEKTIRLRLGETAPPPEGESFFGTFDAVVQSRLHEANEFYEAITPATVGEDAVNVMRQALSGMLWTKQFYHFDLNHWLKEHSVDKLSYKRHGNIRNSEWFHMLNNDIISMPDKWEYPWYAAWDLAFHTITLAVVDLDFAKEQLNLMLRDLYLHPSGQIPAYEWNFGDVNPPVHAWATLSIYETEKMQRGTGDLEFLKSAFHKLLLNFTWWVNRKDQTGRNVFQGGFLGLDNIGVFDRSAPLPTGGFLEQADGTAWMALFCQNMLAIAVELASHDPSYEEMALKFVQHFFWIAGAMDRIGENEDEMWDEEDGFFYDLLRFPDGSATRLKVRSMVGLLPLCATTVFKKDISTQLPRLKERIDQFLHRHPELVANIASPFDTGYTGRGILAILNEDKLRRILSRVLDESEFLSPYGVRSLSRYHHEHPFVFPVHGEEHRVDYLPAESNNWMFGGNSNWRGPVWMPVNILIIRALLQFYTFYGDQFTIECPTGSGNQLTLFQVAKEISRRLTAIFLRDVNNRRPVYGGNEKFQSDSHWQDLILFYEYFHGDNGAGLGANHQTGWTGIVGSLIQVFGSITEEEFLRGVGEVAFTMTKSKEG